jgi:hypothetical protein
MWQVSRETLLNWTKFFPRLAAVPGVAYSGLPDIDREKLPGAKAKPRTQTSSYDGRVDSFVMWDTGDGGSTSQSPAAQRASAERDTGAPSDVLRSVYEALELPGTAGDYHFALLHAYESLRKHCRSNPDLLVEFERLCLLDVSLIQARPEAIMRGTDEKSRVAVPAFHYLIRLYEREGFLADALVVAKRAAAFGQGDVEQNRLTERIQELEAEDV